MTKFEQISVTGSNAFVFCIREDRSFWLNFGLQCSGAVLVESRSMGGGGLMSSYVRDVVRDGYMSNRMYGMSDTFMLNDHEIDMIHDIYDALREEGDWDERYAPGSSFTGHDITPVNGIGDFNHPQAQGFTKHRYHD